MANVNSIARDAIFGWWLLQGEGIVWSAFWGLHQLDDFKLFVELMGSQVQKKSASKKLREGRSLCQGQDLNLAHTNLLLHWHSEYGSILNPGLNGS